MEFGRFTRSPSPAAASESSYSDLLTPEPARSPDLDLPAESPVVEGIDEWLTLYGPRPAPRARSPAPLPPPVGEHVSINITLGKTKWGFGVLEVYVSFLCMSRA